MENERMNLWKEPKYLPLIITSSGSNEEPHTKRFANFLFKYNKKYKAKIEGVEQGLSVTTIFESAKEIIFDYIDNKPILHFIMFAIDASSGQIEISHHLDEIFENKTEEEIREEMKSRLALAKIFDIPVYPNTDEVLPILAKYHHDMLVEGFRILLVQKLKTLTILEKSHLKKCIARPN